MKFDMLHDPLPLKIYFWIKLGIKNYHKSVMELIILYIYGNWELKITTAMNGMSKIDCSSQFKGPIQNTAEGFCHPKRFYLLTFL